METLYAIGGAILSSAFQGLLDRLTSVDLLNYARELEVLSEIKKWEKMLRKLYAFLDDAEEKQWNNQLVQMWVSDLRDLAYDVEDVLDDLVTEAYRRKLQAEPLARASKVQKIVATVSAGMNLTGVKFNAEMLPKIQGISAKLQEIIKEKNDLHLGECSRTVTQRLPTSSLVKEPQVYGREKDKLAVIETLKAVAYNADVSIVPIVGMGGVGKTTLAQLIFNDTMLEFDLKSWVSVGEDFDVVKMTKKILEVEGSNDKDLDWLQQKLKQNLSMKKFLVVLDDVWTENYEDWTLFSPPFRGGAPGSTLIITTRSGDVSSMMGTVRPYLLRKLSYENCMSVFAQHALGATNCDEHLELKEIGVEIVKKCDGLPLAAKALGGILRGKLDPHVWEEVLTSEMWDQPNDKSKVLPALRLSYFHLPAHLKRCFAYCALFPKDYEFNRDELVLLWMAEGFLHQPKKKKQMQDLGCQYFDDLLSGSFFQRSSGKESRFVMHDLMNDLARYISTEICCQLEDKLKDAELCGKIRHLSFIRHEDEIWLRFECFSGMQKLRTFLSMPIVEEWRHYSLSGKALHELVPKLKCLRVLSLAGYDITKVPTSIGGLKHLRYLNLSRTHIERLPESVGELFNLQTLILSWCPSLVKLPSSIGNLINLQTLILSGCYHLNELPSSIGYLINLQCLDISETDELQEMPQEIGNLINLQKLTKFILGKDNGLKITALQKLSHLQGKLHVEGLQNVEDVRDADLANLKEKQRLEELELEWAGSSTCELQVLNLLQPHKNVKRLTIRSFGGTEWPLWMGDPTFRNMVQIELYNCHNVISLPPLGVLPSLEKLIIREMYGVNEVGVEFCGEDHASSFPCLEILRINNMKEWEHWSCYEGAVIKFPNLHELTIFNCPKLGGKLPSPLPSLQKLLLGYCKEEVLRSVCGVASLTSLRMYRISGLVSLDESLHIEELVALEDLTIDNCGELKYLCKDGTNHLDDKLASLKSLEVKWCGQLVSLVEGEEGQLPSRNLQSLKIFRCHNLEKLPSGLHTLASLKYLNIFSCNKLKTIFRKRCAERSQMS